VTESAGTLLYRRRGDQMEVLIVHPSGRYNRGAPWSIPKGKTEPGEDAETAARRETQEETGVSAGPLHSIGSVDLARSRKRIYGFAGPAPEDAAPHCASYGFAGPAPEDAAPHCASWEVDRARFVTLERARLLLHPAQAPFVDRMLAIKTRTRTRTRTRITLRTEQLPLDPLFERRQSACSPRPGPAHPDGSPPR